MKPAVADYFEMSVCLFYVLVSLLVSPQLGKKCSPREITQLMFFSHNYASLQHWERLSLPSDQEQAPQMSDEQEILHCGGLVS
jgi:hypothetical protein